MPHPHLLPALIGAAVGLPLIVLACVWYVRRWQALSLSKRWLYGVAIGLFEIAYWLNVYAWLIEPRLLVVRQVEIVSEDWRGGPLRIAIVSDTHAASPHVDAARVARVVERVNALAPDIVMLLGDYAGSHEPEAERSGRERSEVLSGVAAFANLEAPLGVMGVIGNHDTWYGRESIERAMVQAGVETMWNRHVVIDRPAGDFIVTGLADEDTGDPDYATAIENAPDLPSIVIAHSPDAFEMLPAGAALFLAGHGHCGQVTIPFLGRPILPLRNPRYGCHRVDENGKIMYVTAGIGTSILPVRFLNPPEIVLITLRAS